MKTNLTIEKIAELIGEKVWSRGDLKRIYINRVGYNTKKMKTTAYIYLAGKEVRFFANVDCYNQGAVWCDQRAKEATETLKNIVEDAVYEKQYYISTDEGKFVDNQGIIVNEPFYFSKEDEATDIWMENTSNEVMTKYIMPIVDEEINNESETIVTEEGEVIDLSETVKGYYTEWREVRIPINHFGKLATRNRQFVVFCELSKSDAPRNFVQLSEKAFAYATRRSNESMLEPYQEPIDYEQSSDLFEALEEKRAQEEIERKESAKLAAIEKEKQAEKALVFASELENMSGVECLKAWKEAGFPHPCPKMIADFKNQSGLGWRQFEATL